MVELMDWLRDRAGESETPLQVVERLLAEEAEVSRQGGISALEALRAEYEAKLKAVNSEASPDAPVLESLGANVGEEYSIEAFKGDEEFRFVERKGTSTWGGWLLANFSAEFDGIIKDAIRAMGPNLENLPGWREGKREDDKGPAEPSSQFEVIVRIIH